MVIQLKKTARLITHNTKHIQSTAMSEQYLHKQIKTSMGWLENILIETFPVESVRPPISCTADNRTKAMQCKDPAIKGGEERNSASPSKQDSKASSWHDRCDK